ncbi:MAG: O-succinylhomoserine sulfhydrylase [Sneathiellaceae bacterium]
MSAGQDKGRAPQDGDPTGRNGAAGPGMPAGANWRLGTRLVRGGLRRSNFGETAEALYLTSGFCYDSAEAAEARFKGEAAGFVYSRFGNPTVRSFEERLALLEGAEDCRATASGMAAVNAALMCQLKAGDRVVAARALFGSCRYIIEDIMPRFGIDILLVDGTDLAQWREALAMPARLVFFETPANPTLDLVDIEAVCALAHAAGATVVVDNVFATPVLQRPLELGADVTVYSATKHIDGQGRCLGGAVLGRQAFIDDLLTPYLRHTGPSLSPFNAWVMLKGLETLPLRFRQHCESGHRVAHWLRADPRVGRVIYPGFADFPQADLVGRQMSGSGGPIVSFELAETGKARVFRFLNGLALVDISNNLGDSKSLITHPATTTHQRLPAEERARLGISEGLVRLSVGLEDVEDLLEDLDRALDA